MRALKARDGRSYEALVRRPSVNASTFHRYCSGATVPEEFAMIDRLVLLCGADEEAVSAVVDDGLPLRPKPVRIRRPHVACTMARKVSDGAPPRRRGARSGCRVRHRRLLRRLSGGGDRRRRRRALRLRGVAVGARRRSRRRGGWSASASGSR
ncbi:helix-turn-helix domain-containing protein [Streptomyces globisporus]|uniref:helix-turn-helix domain-containing protein n=1 Tax=Streptomyces globisporus TaxID=1908 RepID=UPI0036BE2D9E